MNQKSLSVAQLRRLINKEHEFDHDDVPPALFRASDTDTERGHFRLQPLKLVIEEMTQDQRAAVKEQLQVLMNALG